MIDQPTLHVDHETSGVTTITIDRPEAHNALDRATMSAFAEAVSALAESIERGDAHAPRAIVITGAGDKAFCSGGDQDDLEHATSLEDGAWLAKTMGDALRELEQMPVPTIAAIEGHALGGGAELALACDIRIVSRSARVGLVHRRLALIPGWGGGQRLMRLVGYDRAIGILLDARALSGPELDELGLVREITAPGGALTAARELAARLAGFDRATVAAIKALLRDGFEMSYEEALAAERDRFPALWAGQAHLDAITAFHEGTSRAGRDERPEADPDPDSKQVQGPTL